ncbi:MAG: hypothetical protein V4608_16225 [Bacteroidota bacterium]
MKNLTIAKATFIGLVLSVFLISGCKSNGNDNTARPTIPDNKDRNIGDDGTSDKLIDPFYDGEKKGNKEQSSAHH